MKKVTTDLQDKLLDYIDGKLSPVEQRHIEEQLKHNADLRACYEDLKTLDKALLSVKLEQPARNFTQMVMSRLDQYPLQSKFSFRTGILLLLGVLVVIGIASMLVTAGVFDQTTTIDMNQVNLPEKYISYPLPSFSIDGKLIVNIIIILNLGLGWLVLDRTILKPYFQRRMQSGV